MARSLALFAIGLVFGGGAGFVLAAANGVTFDGHDHADPNQHGGSHAEAMAHDHSTAINLPAGQDAGAADAPSSPLGSDLLPPAQGDNAPLVPSAD